MESSARSKSEQNRDDPGKVDALALRLEVHDPAVIAYLLAFDESERVSKANEALHIGVFVIQSAIPTSDLRGLP
jgi:hypothetical protein